MKKFVAVLLCVAMLMVGVVAQAENGYTIIQAYLNSDNCSNLTEIYSNTLDEDNEYKTLTLAFNLESQTIILIGDNWQGHTEATLWITDDWFEGLKVILTFCDAWDTVEDAMDEDYSFSIWLMANDDDTPTIIESKEEAEALIAALASLADN